MHILYTLDAQNDLNSLLDYILKESPKNARIVLNRIERYIRLIASQPEMGRPGRVPHTREAIVPKTPFIIPYQVLGNKLIILRIYHCSQKWDF